jgi:hypothetical protein
MQIERTDKDVVVNGLPDGSKVIVDSTSEKVFALNATAGAAWDACGSQTTLAGVAEEMRRTNPAVSDEVAEQAVLQLQEKKLVKASGLLNNASRRQVLAGLTAVALPLVVSMTMTEQKAFADRANSRPEPPSPPKTDDNWNSHRPNAHVSHRSDSRLN